MRILDLIFSDICQQCNFGYTGQIVVIVIIAHMGEPADAGFGEPMSELLKKPERPKGHECCGGGCCPCIWDHYYAALGRWEEQQEGLPDNQPNVVVGVTDSMAENTDA